MEDDCSEFALNTTLSKDNRCQIDAQTKLKVLYWIWVELEKVFREPESKRPEMFAKLFADLGKKMSKATDDLGSDAPTTGQLIEWLIEMKEQAATL